jgi:hypothetical protein
VIALYLVTEGASWHYGCGDAEALSALLLRYRAAGILVPDPAKDHVIHSCCRDWTQSDVTEEECPFNYADSDTQRVCLLGAYSLAVLEGRYDVAAKVAIDLADHEHMHSPPMPEAVEAAYRLLESTHG